MLANLLSHQFELRFQRRRNQCSRRLSPSLEHRVILPSPSHCHIFHYFFWWSVVTLYANHPYGNIINHLNGSPKVSGSGHIPLACDAVLGLAYPRTQNVSCLASFRLANEPFHWLLLLSLPTSSSSPMDRLRKLSVNSGRSTTSKLGD